MRPRMSIQPPYRHACTACSSGCGQVLSTNMAGVSGDHLVYMAARRGHAHAYKPAPGPAHLLLNGCRKKGRCISRCRFYRADIDIT